jgi:hypothetical protein
VAHGNELLITMIDDVERERQTAIIEEARATVARLAYISNRARAHRLPREESNPAHVPDLLPDVSNAIQVSHLPPREDVLEHWARNMPKPEPEPPRRKLDTAPIDVPAEIAAAIEAERVYTTEALMDVVQGVHAVAEAMENALARDADNLRHEVKVLNAEVASLKATLAELRLTVADTRKAKVESFELPVEPASRQ